MIGPHPSDQAAPSTAVMAAIARTATSTRARLAAEGRRTGGWEPGLSGECVRASFAVRDALRAAGHDARVRAGYFEVDIPDPETCLCGNFEGHPRSCRFVPHAWVEAYGCVVDVTADQFNGLCFGGRFKPVEVLPIDEALRQRWRARLPSGVRGNSLNGGWRAGEVREFNPA